MVPSRLVGPLSPPLILAAALVTSGCSTTTTIRSNPPGAKVYLDGTYKGETPLSLDLPDGTDHGYKHLRLEKEGFPPTEASIGRKQNTTRLVCGYFCLVPLLWMYKWDEAYSFTLGESQRPASGGFAPKAPEGQPAPTQQPAEPPARGHSL